MPNSLTLWHLDIIYSNLLVSKEGPAKVEGLVDWRHSTVPPYSMQAQFLSIFIGGLIDLLRGAAVPQLLDHVSTLTPEEQVIHRMHLKVAYRHTAYELKMMAENKIARVFCAFRA